MSSKQEFNSIYDEFRDAELNKEYYAERIAKTRRRLRNIDIYLAIFAGSSGVIGFSLWSYAFNGIHVGQIMLGLLTGVAIIVLIAKPYLRLEDEVERLSGIQSTYSAMSHVLKDLVLKVKELESVPPEVKVAYDAMRRLRVAMQDREDKPSDRKLVEKKQAEVNERYPVDWFYYP